MFWGLIMEPNKRYTQMVERPFHITQAAMDISTGDNDPCQVMVVFERKNFLVCTLQKNNNIQVPLDLYFESGHAISFLTNGKCNVHLTGYLDTEFEEEAESSGEEEEEEEDEDEAPTMVSVAQRKLENNTGSSANKKLKKGKKAKAPESLDDDDDEEDTEDNDNTTKEKRDEEDSSADEEEEEEADDEPEEESEEAETTLDTSNEDSKVDTPKLSKSAKRRLKKKLAKTAKAQQFNGVDKAKVRR